MDKKGIELSVNFIVIIVFSIVIFAGGIFLAQKMFSGAESVLQDLDAQSEQRIEALLDDGARVAIPFRTKEVERGESGVFGVGIINIFASDEDFDIGVMFDSAYDGDSELCAPASSPCNCLQYALCGDNAPDQWLIWDKDSHHLKVNEKDVYLINVKVPNSVPRGTYIFDVSITYDDGNPTNGNPDNYDPTRKLLVTVV